MADFQSCKPPMPGGLAALVPEARLEGDAVEEAGARDRVVVDRGMPVHGRGGRSVPSSSVPRGVLGVGAEQRDDGEVGDGAESDAEVVRAIVLVDPDGLVVASSS